MPAWDKTLTEQDMWKITMLLSHLDKLPPAVQDYWKTSFGVAPIRATKRKKAKRSTTTTNTFREESPLADKFHVGTAALGCPSSAARPSPGKPTEKQEE